MKKITSLTLAVLLPAPLAGLQAQQVEPPHQPANSNAEAHPPVGQQPRRPAGYKPYHYPKSAEDLLREETPAFLKRAHDAWQDMTKVVNAGPYRPTPESFRTHPCPEWFLDAKFGMFIDWGPWSVAGWAPQEPTATYPDWYEDKLQAEYREYHLKTWGADIGPDDFIQLMRGESFRPVEFVNLAKAAGMRYVVPFLKHHGGYCLWNSSFTHRNSVEWGLNRDVAAELADACRAAGLRYGAYVSLGEWNYPVVRDGKIKYLGFNGQVRDDAGKADRSSRARCRSATSRVIIWRRPSRN